MATDSLRVMNWNARSVGNKKDEFREFLKSHDIDVAVLTETHLKPEVHFSIVGYDVIRQDRTTEEKCGGVAILVRNAIAFSTVEIATSVIESVGIELDLTTEKLNIFAVYCPRQCTSRNEKQFKRDLRRLTRSRVKFLACGDLNARHKWWWDDVNNKNGELVFEDVPYGKYTVNLPTQPSFISWNGKSSFLDICLANFIIDRPVTVHELSSDHYPVICDVGEKVPVGVGRRKQKDHQKVVRANYVAHPGQVWRSKEDTGLALEVLCQAIETVIGTSVRQIVLKAYNGGLLQTADCVTGMHVSLKNNNNLFLRQKLTNMLHSMFKTMPQTPSDTLKMILSQMSNGSALAVSHDAGHDLLSSSVADHSAIIPDLLQQLKFMRRIQENVTAHKQACLAPKMISLHQDQELFLLGTLRGFRPSLTFSSGQHSTKDLHRHLRLGVKRFVGKYRSRSSSEAIFTMRQILQKCREYNGATHHLFLDLKTSYDAIDREQLWRMMSESSCWSEDFIQEIEMTVNKLIPEPGIGLKRDAELCRLLMAFVLEAVIREANVDTTGTIFQNDFQIICFADDLGLIAKDLSKLESAYAKLKAAAIKVGLVLDTAKAKYMKARGSREVHLPYPMKVILAGDDFEAVESVVFLQTLLTVDNDLGREIRFRVANGKHVYNKYRESLKSTANSRNEKVDIYKTQIRPHLIHGHQSWILLKADIKQLVDFESDVLRTIHGRVRTEDGKSYDVTYPELVRMLGEPGVEHRAKLGRLRWVGNVMRMADDCPARIALETEPAGKRPTGGQPARWIQRVEADLKSVMCGKNWRTVAKDAVKWDRLLDKAKDHWVRSRKN